MEKDVLLKITNESGSFGWNELNELEKSDELNAFIATLNTTVATTIFRTRKNNLLNDLNYHLYILKKYGNLDSRSRLNVNDADYLTRLWTSFTNHLIKDQSAIDEDVLLPTKEPDKNNANKIKSEVVINYLEWLAKKIESTDSYGDLILLFYKVKDIFLELYIKQN